MTPDSRAGPEHAEVWWSETPTYGRRPVVVLTRTLAIKGLRRALVAPCTTTVRGLLSEVELDPRSDPVPRLCVVGLDAAESVSVGLLVERIGRLSEARMREVCAALAVAVDCGGGAPP